MTGELSEKLSSPRQGTEEADLTIVASNHERLAEAAWNQTERNLSELRRSLVAERDEIFGAELRGAITRGICSTDPGNGRRYLSLSEAKKSGVDLERLKSCYDRFYGEFTGNAHGHGGTAFSFHDVVVGSVSDLRELPPLPPPDPDKFAVYLPPYAYAWERFWENRGDSGDGSVENRSYLDRDWARVGSELIAGHHGAGDIEILLADRQNGFFIPFRTLRDGILQVEVDLTCLICVHHVSTEDEWGWSDFFAVTRDELILAVYWNREDEMPAHEISHQTFIPGMECRGDGEDYPGSRIEALPGERRILSLFTEMAFPENQLLWLYVGVRDYLYALLNDVSIDISVNSAWQMNSIAVRSV